MWAVEKLMPAESSQSPLTPDDIKLIYQDLAAHEIGLQQGKQACWAAIDAAKTEEEVNIALEAYIDSHHT